MDVSVAVCTWNRAVLLDKTLERMRELHIPDGVEWELLVVNNNCTDHTDDVIVRHANTLPLRRLLESKQGHSHARNCAVDAARGELLIWTDDDVFVGHDWLAEYWKATERHPTAAFFGGAIKPWYEGDPPSWLFEALKKVEIAYAVRDLGPEEFECTSGRIPFGANFAVKTSVQRLHHYDVSLGRNGKGMLGGDDTEMLNTILTKGYSGWWIPTAQVEHFIPQERQSTKYLRGYYEGHGIRLSRMHATYKAPTVLGKPRWLWRAWLESELKYRIRRFLCSPDVWIDDLKRGAMFRGALRGDRTP